MGLYSQGKAFIFSSHFELFNGGSWGGGVGFILAYEAEGFTSFLEKRHIFKATGGAIMGGRMEGCLNGVFKWGGAIFGIHGGAQEGRWIYI